MTLFSQPYKLTCTLSSTYDLTTTGADTRSCTVTAVDPSTFTGSPLTMTVPDGQTSITSGPIFSTGTQVSVDGFLTVTATTVAWDADAKTVTMTDDMTTTLTLTETGPAVSFCKCYCNFKVFYYKSSTIQMYKIGCMYSLPSGLMASDITSAKCTITPTTGSAVELTFSGTDTTVTSSSQFTAANGPYTTSVQIMATATGSNSANSGNSGTQTWDDTDQTVTITTSDQTSSHTLTNSGVSHLRQGYMKN